MSCALNNVRVENAKLNTTCTPYQMKRGEINETRSVFESDNKLLQLAVPTVLTLKSPVFWDVVKVAANSIHVDVSKACSAVFFQGWVRPTWQISEYIKLRARESNIPDEQNAQIKKKLVIQN
jgi:hypothetical protein